MPARTQGLQGGVRNLAAIPFPTLHRGFTGSSRAEGQDGHVVAGMSPTAPSTPTRVLIVEDDESTAEAMAFHMRAAGLEAVVASDGLAGLRSLRSEPPDAVVLDLMLPGVDGWHVIREVREWAPRLPIIV